MSEVRINTAGHFLLITFPFNVITAALAVLVTVQSRFRVRAACLLLG